MDHYNLCYGCMEGKGDAQNCPYCGYELGTAPVSAHHLAPGILLENKYRIGRVLGQGGFGITYIAWDRKLEMKLAIKEYFPQGMAARAPGRAEVDKSSGEIKEQLTFGLQRFLNEAKTLARFAEHPNIVTVRDFFETNSTAYLVMSYVEGVTLEQYLQTKGGRLSFNHCLKIIMPVLDALKEVHRAGIMHRDISPDNIFINKDGRVILIDFGAARQEMREKSKSLSVILKAGYAPEEQYRSRGKQGPWTDIYAVAATMYRSITGQTPLEAMDRLAEDDLRSPTVLGVKIDPDHEQNLLKALSVRAEGRFQTVEEFQGALMSSESVKEVAEQIEKKMIIEVEENERIVAPAEIARPVVDPVVNLDLDADYYIDYANGTIPIGDLPIGARVVDRSWEWEFRTGRDYSRGEGDQTKPVTWLVVAIDHCEDLEPHVTLLSEELICIYAFSVANKNHWGGSNLRSWLNSAWFTQAFSESFKSVVLTTTLPNKEWQNGSIYNAQDKVFIPSNTELGDTAHSDSYQIGKVYPYFQGVPDAKRVARLGGEVMWYWTRSPVSFQGSSVCYIAFTGKFGYNNASYDYNGVRPALNLKSGTLASEIRN